MVCMGLRTRGCMMVGAAETTELWQLPDMVANYLSPTKLYLINLKIASGLTLVLFSTISYFPSRLPLFQQKVRSFC